ncbi:Cyclopentanol dehydrogenase [Methylobrevis pamukkalensis]|uniref:Cyclopentanol dehydrogenase n=1 Tax=Methylobrevis pamukkalensis TaxID=1439726 RepID=A0A1E3GQE8_9HYPH|nr:Cyclopentanol dehydrogenase [Methylobrevis pamukkalensis]
MKDQTIIVTGGGSGLGKAICLGLAAEGAKVAILDIDPAAAGAVVAEIEASGGKAFSVIGDITTRDSAAGLVGAVIEKSGRVHGLCNCAGVYPRKPILEISDADWDFSFSVNVRGLYTSRSRPSPTCRPTVAGGSSTSPRSTPSRPIRRTPTMRR